MSDPAREAEILRSMAEHGWWRHRTGGEPASPLATRFGAADVNETIGINPLSQDYPRAYYGVMGRILALGDRHSIVRDLYVMRVVSMVLALVTLWIAWVGTRIAIGGFGAAVVVLLLALHPQFAIVSTTASPDAAINLAGACVWWLAMSAVKTPRPEWTLAGIWLVAAAAAGADRMGVPLVLTAFVLSVAVMVRRSGMTMRTWTTVFAGAALLLGGLWLINMMSRTFTAVDWQMLMPVPRARTAEFFTSFALMLFRSWWYTAGWVRYVPPAWWTGCVALVTAAAAAGMVRRWSRPLPDAPRIVAAVASIMLIVQMAAVYWTYFRLGTGPQGRHLFPCLVPALVLLWLGVDAWVPTRLRAPAAAALVILVAALDMTAWLLVAMPAYAR